MLHEERMDCTLKTGAVSNVIGIGVGLLRIGTVTKQTVEKATTKVY
jgi:hypothetical protein